MSSFIKIVAVITTTIFFVFDRFLKFIAINYPENQSNLIGDIFLFNFTKNYNIAFSLPFSGFFLNLLVSLIIIILIFLFLLSLKNRMIIESWIISIIIFGSVSNLYDRLCHGFVIDYLDLKYFTVFNIADMMIVGGIIGVLIMVIFDKNKEI